MCEREESKMCENAQPVKRKRVLLTLEKKLEVLESIAKGESHLNVAKKFNLSDSTVRTIKQAEQSIRNSARYGCAMSNSIMFASRPLCIEIMETKLNEWYIHNTKRGLRLTNRKLCEKALEIFMEVKLPDDGTIFRASNSWLLNFKRRFDIQYSKVENCKFKDGFKSVIEQGGFLPEQVFHMDEDYLFWKRLPTLELGTFTEKISMVLCCNASGDYLSIPMIVYKCDEPFPYKNGQLPVFWRRNEQLCIMEDDLEQWYIKCFIPSVKSYLISKSLPQKILILMPNTDKFSTLFKIPNDDISITIRMFSLRSEIELQPLSIGIFPAFKRYYLRRLLSHLSQKIFINPALKLYECWKAFDITNGIEIIKDSIDEISASDINACWRSLWPEVVHEYSTLPNEKAEINEILQVVREINDPSCFNVRSIDILIALRSIDLNESEPKSKEQCIEPNSVDFVIELDDSNDYIIQNEAVSTIENEGEKPIPPLLMPLENLNHIFSSALALEHLVLKLDPCLTRSMKFSEKLEELLRPYKEEKTKILGSS